MTQITVVSFLFSVVPVQFNFAITGVKSNNDPAGHA